jgi:glycerol kinase
VAREHLVALDLGTTGVRALVVDAEGGVRSRARRPLRTSFPALGRVEQDPEDWWARSVEVMREALERSGVPASGLAGIGVVTQRATAVAWDARSGAPLAPAIGWQDQRTAARAAELQERGIAVDTLPSATKFEWWLEHEASVREAAAAGRLRLGTPDAWLGLRLSAGAACVTDPGCASATALYDARKRRWSAAATALFGVDPAWLPEIAPTCKVVGETPPGLLGAPVPVAARAGDQQAAAFAQGVRRPGDAKLTLGTSAMLDVHTGESPAEAPAGAYALPLWELATGERAFCLEGAVVTAGAAVDWLVSLGLLAAPEELDAVAGSVATGEGAFFVPALQGLGTPFMRREARGLLGGITRGTRAAHIVRAALEGVAQRCADLCEALLVLPGALRCDGGLAASGLLLQRIADLAGREVWRAAETETTALGAAHLAGVATGVFEGPERTPQAEVAARFAPRAGEAERRSARAAWRRAVDRA